MLPGHAMLIQKLVEVDFQKQYVCKKYANKKFLKASIFAIDYARNNFEERGMLQGSLLSSVIETVLKDSDLTGASTDGDDDDSADVGEDGDAIEGSRVMATVVLANKPSKSQYLPLPYK